MFYIIINDMYDITIQGYMIITLGGVNRSLLNFAHQEGNILSNHDC
jgi:hypothetical protein